MRPGTRSATIGPRLRRAASAAAALVVLATGAVACGRGDGTFGLRLAGSETATADYRFVIPAGAGDQLAAGEPLEILPGSMDVAVGEVIEIVNNDDRGHLIGPFFVGAGETMRQEFASPGTFEGDCSVHPSGQIVITVQ